MAAPLVLLLGVYPLLEAVMGLRHHELLARAVLTMSSFIFTRLPYRWCWSLLWRHLTRRIDIDGVAGVASAGLNNGASGIVAAHELGHRRPRSKSWWTARLTLFSVLYLHFTTEHNHTHHRHWARDDPTSSPWGRGVYVHVLKTIPRQVMGVIVLALLTPADRWSWRGCFWVDWHGRGWPFLLGYLGQAAVAIYLLEFVNYIQHHGLRRGDDERANATHAWESRQRLSRWTPMGICRFTPRTSPQGEHAYQRLDVHDESPQLPFGYYGMFWLALVPPLFSRLMRRANMQKAVTG